MSSSPVWCGRLRGTGAAVNCVIGWIPETVMVFNMTDGTLITVGHPYDNVIVFTTGAVAKIKRLEILKGNTSGAKAAISDVIVRSGTFAGGDAAGWIIIDPLSKTGTFTTETMTGMTSGGTISGVVDVNYSEGIDTAVANVTGNAAITPYVGVAGGASVGFTIGSTVSTNNKLMRFVAFRNQGGSRSECVNSLPG